MDLEHHPIGVEFAWLSPLARLACAAFVVAQTVPRPRSESLFCYAFSGASETVDSFEPMYEAAKRAMGGTPKLYSHHFTEANGKVTPVAKNEIVLILNDVKDTQWAPSTVGNFLTAAHIADPSAATVRPAWRMLLGGGPSGVGLS